MIRIAIDMDEVIADALSEYLDRYNTDFNANLTKQDILGKRLTDLVPLEHVSRVRTYFEDETFFRDLAVMEGSQEVIRELMDHYEVFIATAAMEVPCSFTPKFEWLQRHFPFLPTDHIVFCGHKGIIAADYLIDDSVYQLDRFRGSGILFATAHNVHETRYPRVENWAEVRTMFLEGTKPRLTRENAANGLCEFCGSYNPSKDTRLAYTGS
jgi:5'-nucleotidase